LNVRGATDIWSAHKALLILAVTGVDLWEGRNALPFFSSGSDAGYSMVQTNDGSEGVDPHECQPFDLWAALARKVRPTAKITVAAQRALYGPTLL
jgi:hypothetical protein